MPTDPYVRVAIVMSANNVAEYECIHWYHVPATPESDPWVAVSRFADALDVALENEIKAVLTTTCAYVGVRCVYHVGDDFWSSRADANAGPGVLSGDFQPPQVAVVLQKTSEVGSRPGHGRFFWPLVAEVNTTGFKLNPGGLTAYDTLCVALIADINADGVDWHPAHYVRSADDLAALVALRASINLKRQGRRELLPLYE